MPLGSVPLKEPFLLTRGAFGVPGGDLELFGGRAGCVTVLARLAISCRSRHRPLRVVARLPVVRADGDLDVIKSLGKANGEPRKQLKQLNSGEMSHL